MEVVLHIGMGKTGTSSIQAALAANTDLLRAQGVVYLGMWFDLVDAAFAGLSAQRDFFRSTADAMKAHAERFVQRLEERQRETGARRFILSNEAIFGEVERAAPFVEALAALADTRLIAYVRDPREWLPSAYVQWSAFHKNYPGPLRTFRDMAPELAAVYSGFRQWGERFPDILTVRPFSSSVDVVEDFATVLGLRLDPPARRSLERIGPAEALLRIFYNTRSAAPVLPHVFDEAFNGAKLPQAPRIADLVRDAFDYSATDAIVADRAAIFEYIDRTFGLDLLGGPAPGQEPVDVQDLRNRALEHVLQIVMHQADRIGALERAVAGLQQELARK